MSSGRVGTQCAFDCGGLITIQSWYAFTALVLSISEMYMSMDHHRVRILTNLIGGKLIARTIGIKLAHGRSEIAA
jgi:hypothetical protein